VLALKDQVREGAVQHKGGMFQATAGVQIQRDQNKLNTMAFYDQT
jgi:hypothetical protein